MNITESRRPQDGRIKLTTQGREVDLRVSSLPTIHGESIVMRVLDKQVMMIGIEQIGMTKKVLEVFRKICTRPNGVVLVTGPTGSGKTTTLYAAVTDRLNPDEKFITTEDPVEYEVPGLVQVNINSKVGLTFGACLRAILRQDPDVILVGEIRDVETATISIQAALTGHLVFSTLHTNSAAATVTRLIDMGIEPFLLTSTLQVVIGQRLVRSICQSCREVYEPEEEELAEFAVKPSDVEGITFYHGAGCEECNYSGYRGRLGLFEMMAIDDEIRDMILERATADEVHERAVNLGMMTMRQDGFLKVCMGVTTFSEVSHHVAPETEEAIRREIEPLIKTLRQKLAGIENTSGEQKALPDPEEEPLIPETPSADFLLQTPEALSVDSDSELEALIGSVNKIPGDSQWGLDALPAEGIETPPELGEPADADNLDEVLETDSEDDSLQGLPMPDSLPDSIPGEESKE
jgi:Tfp pilus assembly pilus retraction ATPase PilT